MGLSKVRFMFDSQPVMFCRFVELLLRFKESTVIHMRFGKTRIGLDGTKKSLSSFVKTFLLSQHHAEVVMSFGQIGFKAMTAR